MTDTERKALVKGYLGKAVTVEIDRPIGYVHQKETYALTYPINYGYIPGVLGGDGEELDVYVLGIDKPVKQATVRIIGIAYRANDVEDKLVAAPEGILFDQAEIYEAIRFQEQYYRTTVESLLERSCGVILQRQDTYLLLFQQRSRTWSFPKGHREPGETYLQTALREVYEETGLTVTVEDGFAEQVEYPLQGGKKKQVILFRARVDGEVCLPQAEIKAFRWVQKQQAIELLGSAYERLLAAL